MNKYMNKIKELMEKEMVRYVIAGGLTTAVNFVSFFILRLLTNLSRSEANVIAIMLAIIFAYFANGFVADLIPKREFYKDGILLSVLNSFTEQGVKKWN